MKLYRLIGDGEARPYAQWTATQIEVDIANALGIPRESVVVDFVQPEDYDLNQLHIELFITAPVVEA